MKTVDESNGEKAAKTEAGVPVAEWQMWPESDWAEYLSGPVPLRFAEDEKTILGTGGKTVGTLNDDGTVDWVEEAAESSRSQEEAE